MKFKDLPLEERVGKLIKFGDVSELEYDDRSSDAHFRKHVGDIGFVTECTNLNIGDLWMSYKVLWLSNNKIGIYSKWWRDFDVVEEI